MKMPRPTEADKDRFRSLVPEGAGVEVKPMFGQLGAFVNGNMFAGLFGPAIGVKLEDAGLQEARAAGGGPFGPEERPMGGFVTVPEGASEEESLAWVARARDHVSTFPPKVKK